MRLEVTVALVFAALAVLLFSVRRRLLRIPRGLCVVELLGRQRILWLGPIPWFEVTSVEPGHEGEVEGPFGHGAIFRLRAMTDTDRKWLDADKAGHARRLKADEEREARRLKEAVRIELDAPKYTHSSGPDEGTTWCGALAAGNRIDDSNCDCPHCKANDADIPF